MKTSMTTNTSVSAGSDTRLHGRWLIGARVVWIVLSLLALLIFFGSIPSYLAEVRVLCTAGIACNSRQIPPPIATTLRQLGISLTTYALLSLFICVAAACVNFMVALVIFWRRSDDWMALLAALWLVGSGANILVGSLQSFPSFWQFPSECLSYCFFVLLCVVFCLFPDGRFRPRWTFWLLIGLVLVFFVGYFANLPEMFLIPFLIVSGALLVGLLVAQVYRYRRLSSPLQRQQTKWVVFGLGVVVAFEIAVVVLQIFVSSFENSLPGLLVIGYGAQLVTLLLPLSIGIAMLRYRLWDIDAIINKALVYGSLTALLAALYFGLIFALQFLFQGMFHQSNALAIVVSTLAIAALFQPLRHRIQAIIDRRFYRRKYDAAKTVEAFSATLRNEVDLSQLSEHLLNVVQETMQPTQVSLWLRKSDPERKTNIQV